MKLIVILLCAATCHYCHGYLATDGEISEEVLTGNDTSVEYLLDTTNDTSSNGSLLRHGIKSKIKTKIGNIKNKIGDIKNKIGGGFKDNSGYGKTIGGGYYNRGIRTNSGSGAKGSGTGFAWMWALLGIAIILVVTLGGLSLYYYQTRRRNKRYRNCEVQEVNRM